MALRLLFSLFFIIALAHCSEDTPKCYKGRELNSLLSMPCDALKDIDKVMCETGTCHDLGGSLPPDALFCCCSQKHPYPAMKLIVAFSVLIPTAAALHCFVGTLMVGSYNQLPPKDCGDIDNCINGTMETEEGGLFMAGCDKLIIKTYGSPDQQEVSCPKGEMNTCQSMDFVGADNITTSKGTVCCCDDDWCNKAAFGVHSLAIPLLIVSAVKWIV
ncbi:hypothetical protein PRIPAC_81458 [Pristionchus pacificus]|uniref:Uncharacterized protein n=1 Tax=Pristionchus pacificus TaxID=54126 RepID=A0A2A6CBQ7_PRIPA|nr:hypothetical protein PRIPAC_81458 [Pristionchus pacificus]|eukprot:PDM75483.1 hypothetical protein PRIPAC_42660 [Pristionchus pacificus]